MSDSIGKILKEKRESLGLTIEQVAEERREGIGREKIKCLCGIYSDCMRLRIKFLLTGTSVPSTSMLL